jgi:hypothetical protein
MLTAPSRATGQASKSLSEARRAAAIVHAPSRIA